MLKYYNSKFKKVSSSKAKFWIKFFKEIVGDEMIYLLRICNSPKHSNSDILVIVGCFNWRMGNKPGFITDIEKDLNYASDGYESDSVMPLRNNKDHSVYSYGPELFYFGM